MRPFQIISCTAIGMFILLCFARLAPGQTGSASPLEPFDKFIGTWKLDNAEQVFEWGVGRTLVRARSYRITETGRHLVGEGVWFWHPGEAQIMGYSTATGMPVELFDYTTSFKENKMVSDLYAYDKNGKASQYREIMEMTSDSTYRWMLIQEGKTIMEGTFNRLK